MSGGIIGGGKALGNIYLNKKCFFLQLNFTIFLFLDEVGALVVDIGSYTTRAGYAGEDMPKVFIILVFLE